MKAIIKRPYQRQLLVVLSMATVTGCSGIQSNATAVYKSWEKRAYDAYKIAAPVHKQGVLPALFKTVSVPGMNMLKKPKVFRANYTQQAAPAVKTETKDSRYIEQHYGL